MRLGQTTITEIDHQGSRIMLYGADGSAVVAHVDQGSYLHVGDQMDYEFLATEAEIDSGKVRIRPSARKVPGTRDITVRGSLIAAAPAGKRWTMTADGMSLEDNSIEES